MSALRNWNTHPEIEEIKKMANYIDKTLDHGKELTLKTLNNRVKKISTYYAKLCAMGFIDALPYPGKIKGLRKGVIISLPKYAFKDYLIGMIQIHISNILEGTRLNDEERKLLSITIKTVKECFQNNNEFKKFVFFDRDVTELITEMEESNFTYRSLCETLGTKKV